MMTWRFHDLAIEELDEALAYYASVDPELAYAFEAHVMATVGRICQNPALFNLRRKSTRRANLRPRFGEYYLPYEVKEDHVFILAVAHAKRQPNYWLSRR